VVVVAAQHREVRVRRFDGVNHAAQMSHGVDGVFDADNVAARVGESFHQRGREILAGQAGKLYSITGSVTLSATCSK
jgi:hypothetical protein